MQKEEIKLSWTPFFMSHQLSVSLPFKTIHLELPTPLFSAT